ncbi:MAG: hypothetical protein C0507_21905 [Cyanobacteria bacterium PR.3.49]|nr:hypothetical protein [Cyanobacteria bacterium PR.3.49]
MFDKANEYSEKGLWTQAIACYKKALTLHSTHFGYLTHCIKRAVEHDPLNPDGHIALGLAFQNSPELFSPRVGAVTDLANAEFEFKQAIALSSGGKNAEAEALLKALPALAFETAQYMNSRASWRTLSTYKDGLIKRLLFVRWNPPNHKGFLLTRIEARPTEYGDIIARVEVPSSNPQHDKVALDVCQTMIDDFGLPGEFAHFQFASDGSKKWVEQYSGGNFGKLSQVALKDESVGKVVQLVESFVSRQWTAERIHAYCRSDTRLPIMLQCRYHSVGGKRTVMEDFNCPLNKDLLPAFWRIGISAQRPVKFSAVAKAGEWCLEYGPFRTEKFTDDEFLMHRISDAVFLSLRKFELAHADELTENWMFRSRVKGLIGSLERNSEGKVVAYRSKLQGGAELEVKLSDKQEIESILVDGKQDLFWNKAYKEQVVSSKILENISQSFLNY